MIKKTNYFSHDSNARNDEKLLAVRMRHGVGGYGVYFMILERLREESDYMSVKDYNLLAFDFRVSSEIVKSVVEDFGLFYITEDGKKFFSESFLGRMKSKDEEKYRRSIAGKKGMESRWNNNDITILSNNDNNVITSKVKESKVNESKEKDVTDVTSKKKDLNPVISEPEETHPPVAPPPLPDPDFEKFQKWILEKAPQVAKLKEPFTEEEYLRIKEEFPPGMTAEVLLAMHNCKDLLKKYVSANLTFRNWIKRRIDDGKNANNRKPDKASDEEFARGLAATALRLEYESLDKGHITPDEFKRRTGIEPLPRQARNY